MSIRTLVMTALGMGCAARAPGVPAASGAPLAVAPDEGGVALRWAGSRPLWVRAQSEGVGPVLGARRDGDGRVTLAHPGGVEERWDVTRAEAEQTWRFPTRPASGQVAVGVSFEGAALHHEGDDGVWLRLPSGGTVRYGHATWVDARGRRTAVRSRWDGTRVAIAVPAEVVARTAWPAVLDPLVSQVFPVDPAILTYTRPRMARPAAAFNNGVHLVAWAAGAQNSGLGLYPGIQFARVSAAGAVLDPYGFTVPHEATTHRNPVVVALGSGFFLAWDEDSLASFGARVDAAGRLLDAPRMLLGGNSPALACHPDGCLLVTSRAAVRLGPDGATLGPVAAVPPMIQTPSVARTAGGYVVAWATGNASSPAGSPSVVSFLRLDREGVSLDAAPQPASFAASNRIAPRLASDGTSALLVWNATVGSGSRAPGIYGVLVPPSGPAPTSPLVLATTTTAPPTDVVWDGANYLVTWQDASFGTVRVSPSGVILDASPRPAEPASPYGSGAPVLSVGPSGPQAFWIWSGDGTAYTSRLGADGRSVAPAVHFARAATPQHSPASAWDGSNFVVTWLDQPDNLAVPNHSLRAARITPAGVVLDRPPLVLASAPMAPTPLRVPTQIAGDASGYIALASGDFSTTATPIVGLRFTAAGAAGSFSNFSPPGVNGNRGFQWIHGRTNNLLLTVIDSRATRMSSTGAALDAFPIALGWSYPEHGAFDGTNYFLVGQGYGARVSAEGDLLDAPARRLAPMPTYGTSNVSFVGGNYLVTWRTGDTPMDPVRGVLVRTSGEVADTTPRTFGPANTYWQTSDGLHHVLVYRATDGALTAQRVSAAGALLDPTPLPLSPADPTFPTVLPEVTVASNSTGQTLVTSAQFDPTVNTTRIVAQIIDSTSSGLADAGVDAGPADSGPPDAGVDSGMVAMADSGRDGGLVDVTDIGPVAVTDSGADGGLVDVTDGGAPMDDAGRDAGAPVADTGADTGAVALRDAEAAVDAPATVAPGGGDGGGLCAARPWSSSPRTGEAGLVAGLLLAVAVRKRRALGA